MALAYESSFSWPVAEEIADRLRRLSGSPSKGQVHLHSVARALRVSRIVSTQLAVDGQVSWDVDGPAILIREGLPPARKRFTLAHELAHVAVGHEARRQTASLTAVAGGERLCDAVAAALLMPKAHIEEWLLSEKLTIGAVDTLAADLGVSRTALVRRVNEVGGPRCWITVLRRSEGQWVGRDSYGEPPCNRSTPIAVVDETRLLLDVIGPDEIPVTLTVRVGPRSLRWVGHAKRGAGSPQHRGGEGIVCLFTESGSPLRSV